MPLLDDELVALAARIPSNLKLQRLKRKYVFKSSQEAVLPKDIVWRRKAGFGAPVRSWLEQRPGAARRRPALRATRSARAGSSTPRRSRGCAPTTPPGRADNSLQLYALLTLGALVQTFLDRTWRFDDVAAAPAPALA